jgi:GT2 family glycosyltransferase
MKRVDSASIILDSKPEPDLIGERSANGVSIAAATGPLISIIVVNYNGINVLPRCMAALSRLDYPNSEVVVVDNGSNDGSAEFAETYSSKFPQYVLRFPKNRGLAAARNAGVRLAKGRYIAFVDNDGFPEPDWLNAALDALAQDPRIGIVAPFVFFDKRPDIINGLGGGVSERGIGFDYLYNRPFGFYSPPKEILYAMGNGMVIRQEAASLIFPIDEMLLNYYDDVEIGIRSWKCGYRVEPCSRVRVKHAFSHSSRGNPRFKEILCHRNRMRTVLKYWPLRKLPVFILNEFRELSHEMWHNHGDVWSIFFWNLRHLASAISIRLRYPSSLRRGPAPTSLAKELRLYPRNADFAPRWEAVREVVDMETADHMAALDYGWYYLETIQQTPFRYTADIASAFLRTKQATNSFLLRFMPYTEAPFTVELVDKAREQVLYHWEFAGNIFKIHSVMRPVALAPGDFRVLFRSDFDGHPDCGRVLGVGVNFIGLWSLP